MEKLGDVLGVTFKVVIAICALRALIMFTGFSVSIPLVDPVFFGLRDILVGIGEAAWRLVGAGLGT